MDTELLTVSQTAQYLQLSEKTIRRMIGNGSLPASKLGNRTWRIRACDVDEYVSNSCQNKPAYSITNLPELELGNPGASSPDLPVFRLWWNGFRVQKSRI